MSKLSTRRLVQIHCLQDSCEAMARTYRRCAEKALSAGRLKQFAYFLKRECKAARIASVCRIKLEASA